MKRTGNPGWPTVVCLAVLAIVVGVAAMPADAGPPRAASNMRYHSAQDVGLARAFCGDGEVLTGGGAFVEGGTPVQLRQSYPISDASGTIAWGDTAIGWQAASSDFNDTVVAFAICAAP
jgi:hypothetical protein